MVNKNEKKEGDWAHLAICLHPSLPSPPSLHPEPVAKSEKEEGGGKRERENLSHPRAFAPTFPLGLKKMSDIQKPLPWGKSSATVAVLEQLVADRLLPRITDSGAPAWISPHPDETKPKTPQGYVVSFVRLHERGFGVPISRFMRALCEYYGTELHNFSPNSISQAAVFVAVCEGYLGIEAH